MSLFVMANLMAQNLPLNDFDYSEKGRRVVVDSLNNIQNPAERSSILDCSKVWLIVPEDQNNKGFKINLPLGVDLKPILEGFIWNVPAPKKLNTMFIGKATNCQTSCTPQVSAYGSPQGTNVAAFMDGGVYSSYTIERSGKYIVIGNVNGCYVAETFYVACPKDTVHKTTVIEKIVEKYDTIIVKKTDTLTVIDKNSKANLEIDICETLASQIQLTKIEDLSNINFDIIISPNPVSEQITLILDENERNSYKGMEIFSLNGNLLRTTLQDKISITDIEPGTYLARLIFTKGVSVSIKFVKL